jgi:hypothetical protein
MVCFVAIWYTYLMVIWYLCLFSRFGMLYQEKSGNLGLEPGGAANELGLNNPGNFQITTSRKCGRY